MEAKELMFIEFLSSYSDQKPRIDGCLTRSGSRPVISNVAGTEAVGTEAGEAGRNGVWYKLHLTFCPVVET